ncbi:AMP-binding protein [Streptomyces galilaeus]|uniref:AMP-binding protein n=1 Tax=Streptomyces galilaeus TaxID=33899 RepID=UPI0038F78889
MTLNEELSLLAGEVRPFPDDLYGVFGRTAERHPNRPAVREGGEVTTYRVLRDRSEELAGRLHRRGVRPGTAVAVHLERGADAVAALLAVLRLGASYVPLDVHHPPERSAAALAASGAGVLVADGDAPFAGAEGVDIGRVEEAGPPPQDTLAPGPEDPSYVLFTSGSTGEPKGARIPYRTLSNYVSWLCRTSNVTVGSRSTQFSRVSFDVWFTEVLGTLCTGGELVVVEERRRADVEYLVRFCGEQRIERLFLPFAALRPFAEWAQHKAVRLPALTEINTAGEQPHVTEALERLVRGASPTLRLANQYGPTETHVVTESEFFGDPARWPRIPPAGPAIDNCVIALLGAGGEIVPLGEEGEVCVAGVPVGLGYLRPNGTAPRTGFGPIEALDEPWGYRTGDIGVIEEGRLVLRGRGDDQVKISGHRVEPGEIEVLAGQAAELAEVAAVAVDTPGAPRTMVLFAAAAPGAAVDPVTLRSRLAERLPAAVVPSRVVLTGRLPRTSTGKVDRRRLALDGASGRGHGRPLPSLTGEEARIAARLARVLGVAGADAGDSLLTLGGGSLQAMSLMTELATEFGATPGIDRVLDGATVEQLAADLRAGDWFADAAPELPHPPHMPDAAEEIPASPVQQEIWLADYWLDEPAAYNVAVVLDAEGVLDPGRVRHALERTVARHPALRSVLRRRSDRILVHTLDDRQAPLDIHRVGPQEAAATERAFVDRPFDLGEDLPVRAALLRQEERDRLVLVFHQHAVDVPGVQTVVDDLARWYGDPGAEAPEETIRPDAWLRPADAVTLDHWRRTLSGVTSGHLTWLQREDASPSGQVVRRRLDVPPALLDARHNTSEGTSFARMLGSFAHAAQAAGAPDTFVVGVVTTRRTPGVSPLVGCHLGLLPLLLKPGATVSDTVAGTREALATALAHRQISAGEVTDVLPERARLAVTFGFDDLETREVDLGGVRCVLRHVHANALQFPLAITPWTSPLGHAGIDVAFDEGLYAPGTVDSLLAGWSALLAGPTTAEPR